MADYTKVGRNSSFISSQADRIKNLITDEKASPEAVEMIREKGVIVHQLLDTPASDGVLIDFDQDGVKELAVIEPFHGDRVSIYKKKEGKFEKQYECEEPVEFAHGIYGGELCGRPMLVIGHRRGRRDLLLI